MLFGLQERGRGAPRQRHRGLAMEKRIHGDNADHAGVVVLRRNIRSIRGKALSFSVSLVRASKFRRREISGEARATPRAPETRQGCGELGPHAPQFKMARGLLEGQISARERQRLGVYYKSRAQRRRQALLNYARPGHESVGASSLRNGSSTRRSGSAGLLLLCGRCGLGQNPSLFVSVAPRSSELHEPRLQTCGHQLSGRERGKLE